MSYHAAIGLAIALSVDVPADIQEALKAEFTFKGVKNGASYYHTPIKSWWISGDSPYEKIKKFVSTLEDEESAYLEIGDSRTYDDWGDLEKYEIEEDGYEVYVPSGEGDNTPKPTEPKWKVQ